ncbi:MAG TPA: chalcone isomerase family protein [Falsiroseomonas sp.]|nr:chalcone isomerase family protein [Falsiroseomonas sp.]
MPRWQPRCASVAQRGILALTIGTLPPLAAATQAAAAEPMLSLAGCAERSMLGVELYRLEVFLPAGRDLLSVEADRHSPMALRITPLHGREAAPFPQGWQRRLARRISADEVDGLRQVHAGLRHGEAVVIEYRPGRGTLVRKGNALLMASPRNTLLRAMLAMWIHDDPPISQDIRQRLITGLCQHG